MAVGCGAWLSCYVGDISLTWAQRCRPIGEDRAVNTTETASRVWTIGYEKLLPGALVAELEAAGV